MNWSQYSIKNDEHTRIFFDKHEHGSWKQKQKKNNN